MIKNYKHNDASSGMKNKMNYSQFMKSVCEIKHN